MASFSELASKGDPHRLFIRGKTIMTILRMISDLVWHAYLQGNLSARFICIFTSVYHECIKYDLHARFYVLEACQKISVIAFYFDLHSFFHKSSLTVGGSPTKNKRMSRSIFARTFLCIGSLSKIWVITPKNIGFYVSPKFARFVHLV